MARKRRTPFGNRQCEIGSAIFGANPMRSLRLASTVVLLCAMALAADTPQDAARQLAAQVAAKAGAGSAIALDIRNVSSMPEGPLSELRSQIESALRARGMESVEKSRAVAEVEITVSENMRGYLLVAEIRQGQTVDVAMVPLTRAVPTGQTVGPAAMVLRKTPLWSQEDPILDAALLQTGGTSHLLVLDTAKVALYALSDSGGVLQSSQPINANWPRDPRGRLVLRRDHLFDAYLPGVTCSSAGQAVQGTQCRVNDDPWPFDGDLSGFYASARNYFNGTLSGSARGQDVGAFYSAALLPQAAFFTLTDGRVAVLSGGKVSPFDISSWGSGIAALNSGCGSGWQLLAGSAGDFSSTDSVQAYEIGGRDALPVSQKVEFSGPLTALWSTTDHASVMAVSHNLKSGRYEAAILTIACSR